MTIGIFFLSFLKTQVFMAKNTRSGTASKAASKTASKTATKRSSNGLGTKDDETLLKELFIDELKDIYWAEKHLTKALPKMAKAATSEELRGAFEDHLEVTMTQIERLEEVFELLETPARAKKCEGMEGLVKESQSIMEEMPKGTAARDAGLIISAQKVEHYEIAAYGSLVQLAKTMGMQEISEILNETLEEEKETDQLLTELAVSGINITAETEETEE
jgi:ferritin-like metal-binding protein YciE